MHKVSILSFCCIVLSVTLYGQRAFEGRIRYGVEYLSFPDGAEGVEYALPNVVTVYVKGNDYRMEQSSALAGPLVVIKSGSRDSIYHLFEFMGKTALLSEKIVPQPLSYRSILKDEENVIAGRTCNKVYRQAADGNHGEAWVDKKYANPLVVDCPDLGFLPLQFVAEQNGITIQYTALFVGPEVMDDTYFMLPSNFVRLSNDQLIKIVK